MAKKFTNEEITTCLWEIIENLPKETENEKIVVDTFAIFFNLFLRNDKEEILEDCKKVVELFWQKNKEHYEISQNVLGFLKEMGMK